MNNFLDDLRFSHNAEDLPIWRECYAQWFPGHVACTSHRADGQWQRLGVDRSIVLASGVQQRIDEKVRRKNYGDIALEVVANDRTNAPGWVRKALVADYIAYAVLPIGRAFLLPVVQLQLAWSRHGEAWMEAYSPVRAPNPGYTTISCPVPVPVLFAAIGGCLRASFRPVAS